MPGITLTGDQRWDLAARLGLDPRTMTPERVAQRVTQMRERASRSFADSDPSGVLKLDLAEQLDRLTGVTPDDRSYSADDADPDDPTRILKLNRP